MVKEIFLSLMKSVIKLIPFWVSRENSVIKLADLGSREDRSDDHSLTPECLVSVLAKFPQVSVDAMASSTYTVCQKFFSKYESLNSCGIDLFSQSRERVIKTRSHCLLGGCDYY